jgi:DNA-binding NarL/FixJ family response regulator
VVFRAKLAKDGEKSVVARMSADRPWRVVIADDDAVARRVITHALQAAGMTVVAEAADGREAVELAVIHRPDVVVLDAVMPWLDGIRATRLILQLDPGLLVVVLTGVGDDELGPQALGAGAVAVVPSDADLGALVCAVEGAGRAETALAQAAG